MEKRETLIAATTALTTVSFYFVGVTPVVTHHNANAVSVTPIAKMQFGVVSTPAEDTIDVSKPIRGETQTVSADVAEFELVQGRINHLLDGKGQPHKNSFKSTFGTMPDTDLSRAIAEEIRREDGVA